MKLLIPVLLLLYCSLLPAQNNLSLRLGAEGGPYRANQSDPGMLLRGNASAGYFKRFSPYFLQLRARATPEKIGYSASSSVMKFTGQLRSGRQGERLNWQGFLQYRYYSYNLSASRNIGFSLFSLGGFFQKKLGAGRTVDLELRYYSRDSEDIQRIALDGYAATVALSVPLGGGLGLRPGILAERYRTRRRYRSTDGADSNRGTRIGPQIDLRLRRAYLLTLNYTFTADLNRLAQQAVYEHVLQAMWGRYLKDRLSLFLFFRYHLTRLPAGSRLPIELLYTPVNNENWFYIKLAAELSDSSELYLKLGYSSDELLQVNRTFSYWQLMTGMSFSI